MAGRQRVRAVAVDEHATVTPLEQFFDLVFVFTLAQVTTLMAGDLTGSGMMRAVVAVLLVVLIPLVAALPAMATLALLTAILVAMIAFEAVRYAAARDAVGHRGDIATSGTEPTVA